MKKENPFKQIEGLSNVPEGIRKNVMSDASSAKLIMDMAFLFTKNYKATLSSMFLTKKKNN